MTALLGSLTASIDAAMLLTEEKIGPRDGAGKTAVVAMSGGVDSAVSALVMRERGYRVVGMNLRLFSPGDVEHAANPCCGIPAMDDARATCAIIGVPFYALNMEEEFGEAVINRFVDDYANGRTPNPCLECNRHVKFRHLVQRAKMLGADCLATGHYARVMPGDPERGIPHRLLRAVDDRKDQSYVLHTFNQEQLGFIQFPLGAPGSGTATILFDDEAAKRPIASPGQAIVFYDGDEVLGGGTIRIVERVTEHGGEDAERG